MSINCYTCNLQVELATPMFVMYRVYVLCLHILWGTVHIYNIPLLFDIIHSSCSILFGCFLGKECLPSPSTCEVKRTETQSHGFALSTPNCSTCASTVTPACSVEDTPKPPTGGSQATLTIGITVSTAVFTLACVHTVVLLCIYRLWKRRHVRSAVRTAGLGTPPQEQVDSFTTGSGGYSKTHTDVPIQSNAAYGSVSETQALYMNLHTSATEEPIYDVPRPV